MPVSLCDGPSAAPSGTAIAVATQGLSRPSFGFAGKRVKAWTAVGGRRVALRGWQAADNGGQVDDADGSVRTDSSRWELTKVGVRPLLSRRGVAVRTIAVSYASFVGPSAVASGPCAA